MQPAFELLAAPRRVALEPFRFAYARVRGPYVPWTRVQTLDLVAETLERQGLDRTGPAFGVYHDLPFSARDVEAWEAELGWPVAPDASLPPVPAVRVRDLAAVECVGLRYRGDLTSFPAALQLLVEWAAQKEIDLRGPLLERFHVSDSLQGVEERDVYVSLDRLA